MKGIRSLVLVFLFAHGFLFAQQIDGQEVRFRELGRPEGLTELGFTGLQTLAFGQDGMLWCSTQKGLFRFDGQQFTPFRTVNGAYHPLSSLPITALLVANDGALWVGTYERGLYRIGTSDEIDHFTHTGEIDGLADDRIMFIHAHGNDVWVGVHEHGVQRFNSNSQTFQTFIPEPEFVLAEDIRHFSNSVQFMLNDAKHENIIWLGTANGLVKLHTQNGILGKFSVAKKDLGPFGIRSLATLSNTELLVGSWGDGLFRFNTQTEEFTRVDLGDDDFWLNNIKHIEPFGDGKFLIAHPGKGLSEFDATTEKWRWLSQDFRPYFITKDEVGDAWIATYGEGLKVIHQTYQQLGFACSQNDVLSVASHQNKNLMLLSDPLRLVLADAQFRTLKEWPIPTDATLEYPISVAFRSETAALVLFHKGVLEIDLRSGVVNDRTPNILSVFRPDRSGLRCMAVDRSDNVWLGTSWDGLIRLHLSDKNAQAFGGEKAKGSKQLNYVGWVNELHVAEDGTVWYASQLGHGRFDEKKQEFVNFPYRPDSSGVYLKHVSSIRTKGDSILLGGSESGVALRLADSQELQSLLPALNETQGVYSLELANNGTLYASTGLGLFAVSPNGKLQHFGSSYGVAGGEKLLRDAAGNVLLLQNGRLLNVATSDSESGSLTSIRIHRISINGTESVFKIDSVLENGLNLNYTHNSLAVAYSLAGLNPELGGRYFYRLHTEDEWTEDVARGQLTLSSLSPNEYELTVMYRSVDGSEQVSQPLKFKIRPPFWADARFLSALAVFLVLIGWMIYRWRLRQLLRQQQERDAYQLQLAKLEMDVLRAQMNPHFMFNCLNSIKLLIKKQETEKADLYLTKFSRLLRSVLENSSQETIPLQNDLDALRLYLEMEALRFKDRLEWSIDIDPKLNIERLRIQPLLIQPFAENAIWHGIMPLMDRNGRLTIEVMHLDETTIRVIVEDNGVGRSSEKPESKTYSSFGSKVTSRRVELGASSSNSSSVKMIDLKDAADQPIGTRVELTLTIA
ncbi:MAG: histidine kinase [Flavobacteriales bacterium]|nr:histidine kinase [Flavobacteriales bacterium]